MANLRHHAFYCGAAWGIYPLTDAAATPQPHQINAYLSPPLERYVVSGAGPFSSPFGPAPFSLPKLTNNPGLFGLGLFLFCAVGKSCGELAERRSQHPGGLFVHCQARCQNIGRSLVTVLAGKCQCLADRGDDDFMPLEKITDHFVSAA